MIIGKDISDKNRPVGSTVSHLCHHSDAPTGLFNLFSLPAIGYDGTIASSCFGCVASPCCCESDRTTLLRASSSSWRLVISHHPKTTG